jgi:hypothetical protein
VVVRRLQMGLLKLLISSPSGKSVFATAGSLAMFAAIRRASSSVSTFAMSARPLSHANRRRRAIGHLRQSPWTRPVSSHPSMVVGSGA